MRYSFQKTFLVVLACVCAYYITFVLHGYTHMLCAYFCGMDKYYPNIFVLDHTSLWLQSVSENIEYIPMVQDGEFFKAALTSLSGYLVNWILLAIVLLIIYKLSGLHKRFTVHLLYFLGVWNLSAVFNYTPIHVLEPSTHINHVFHEVGVSIWMVFILGGILSLITLYILFYNIMHKVFKLLYYLDNAHSIYLPPYQTTGANRLYFIISLLFVLFYSIVRYVVATGEFLPLIFDFSLWIRVGIFALIMYSNQLHSESFGISQDNGAKITL